MLVECEPGQPSRVHSVDVGFGRTDVFIDARFDAVVETRPLLYLRYADPANEARSRTADAERIAKAVPAGALLLMYETSANTVELELLRGAPAERRALVRVTTGPEGPNAGDLALAVRALIVGKCMDFTEPEPLAVPCREEADTVAEQPVPDDGPLTDEGTVVAGGAGVLAIQPSRLFTKVGHQFRVDLTAARVGNFTRSVVTISYDPRLLKFLRISEGALLEQSTGPSGATLSEKPEAGTLVLEVRRQGSTPSVSGTMASLFFEAQSPGIGHLVIVPMQVVGAGGETFRVTATPGSVVVR